MGAVSRWAVAVASSLACFGACWAGLAAGRVLDTGSQIGIASVPLVVVLTVLGAWAEHEREKKPVVDAFRHPEQALGTDRVTTPISRDNIAWANLEAGRTAEAIPIFEQELRDREHMLGTDHPDTLQSRHNLGWAYRNAGRTAEAIPILEQAFRDRERILGTGHRNTLFSGTVLAWAYKDAGRTAESISLLRRCSTID